MDLTGMSSKPRCEHKVQTWEMMRSLKGVVSTPWLALRVFNEIVFNYEKEGGRPRPQRQLQAFHDALADCDLSDMGFKRDIFT
jgi:hypothetical protein